MCIYYYLRNRFFLKKEEKERHQPKVELPFRVEGVAFSASPPFSVYGTWVSGQQISRKFLPCLICASKTVPQVTESNRKEGSRVGELSKKQEAELCIGKEILKNTKKMLWYILQLEFLGTVMTSSVSSDIGPGDTLG